MLDLLYTVVYNMVMVKESATHYVYGLIDPNTRRIRYIGVSNNPERRLAQHMTRGSGSYWRSAKWAWIKPLKEQGLSPELVILFEGEESEAYQIEAEYIFFIEAMSGGLTNNFECVRGGYKLGHLARRNKDLIAQLATQKEKRQ